MNSTTYDARIFEAGVQAASIHIAIADDYPVLLAGLRQSLAACDDVVVLAECTCMGDLLAQVALKKPEIILLGCESSDADNLARQLHELAERHADARVIVFTGNASLDFHEVALRNGARGVLLKHCAPHSIAETVRKVSRGDLCFDRALTHRMLSTFVQRKRPECPEKAKIATLTGRESEVMSRICEGLRNKEIASKLYISDATVAHHLTSIYRKLGLADRTELLLYAHQNDISSLRAS